MAQMHPRKQQTSRKGTECSQGPTCFLNPLAPCFSQLLLSSVWHLSHFDGAHEVRQSLKVSGHADVHPARDAHVLQSAIGIIDGIHASNARERSRLAVCVNDRDRMGIADGGCGGGSTHDRWAMGGASCCRANGEGRNLQARFDHL